MALRSSTVDSAALTLQRALAGELFPGRGASPAAVSVAVGLMNVGAGWLGAMPCCCGAGGLAAQVARPVQGPRQRKTQNASLKRGWADGRRFLLAFLYMFRHVCVRVAMLLGIVRQQGGVKPIVLSAHVSTVHAGAATLSSHESQAFLC